MNTNEILSVSSLQFSYTRTAFLMICAILVFRQPNLRGQDAFLTPENSQTFDVLGVKECAACHSAPSPIYDQLKVTRFVRLTEVRDWLQDKHSIAYQLIRIDLKESELSNANRNSNRVSKSIVDRLGWKADDGNFERKCLTCHGGFNPSASPAEHERWKSQREFGIQCESCHGPGSEYTKTHLHQQPAWRKLNPSQKKAHGMIDLRSANECAKVCISCHVGNISQSRFITHDMYAAGHPVLPPFELVTFLDAMPPHWKLILDKPLRAASDDAAPLEFEYQKEFFAAHYVSGMEHTISSSHERTKSSIIGALVVDEQSLKMVRDLASDNKYRWGDFALYDCMGCHQELKQDARRWRPDHLIPGRPYIAKWFALRSNIANTSGAEYQDRMAKLVSVFNDVPFGEPKRVQAFFKDSQTSISSNERSRVEFGRQALDAQKTREWLNQLLHDRKERLSDYWTAKQTGWLAHVALDELNQHHEIKSSQLESRLEGLQKAFALNLKKPQKESVLESHAEMLKVANRFDPIPGIKVLEELVELANEGSRE